MTVASHLDRGGYAREGRHPEGNPKQRGLVRDGGDDRAETTQAQPEQQRVSGAAGHTAAALDVNEREGSCTAGRRQFVAKQSGGDPQAL